MFGLDPFNPAIAVVEMLLLLALAALVGWWLGRLAHSGRVNTLRSSIAGKEAELAECRRLKAAGAAPATATRTQPAATGGKTTYPAPVVTDAPTFVSADPLLPAFSRDATPDVVTEPMLPTNRSSPEVPLSPEGAAGAIPVEVPPMGAPIPEVPSILPPMPGPSVSTESVPQAGAAGNSEAAVLNRIAARAGELNFDRIGRATATEADDLKDIVGIGPFLERKLHSLGIYTFRQVANFTKEDINKVNDIIEFFPGRIERDNWVDQAKTFHERKYGAKR